MWPKPRCRQRPHATGHRRQADAEASSVVVHPRPLPCGGGHRLRVPMSWGEGWCLRGMLPGEVGGCWLPPVLRGLCRSTRSRVRPMGLRGPSPGVTRPSCDEGSSTLLTFVPSFPTHCGPSGPTPARRTSSHGVVQRSPLRRRRPRSPLPARRCCHLRAFGLALPARTAFRPRGFSPPRRFAPPRAWPARADLPTLGFASFRLGASQLPRSAFLPCRALIPDRSDEMGSRLLTQPTFTPWGPSHADADVSIVAVATPACLASPPLPADAACAASSMLDLEVLLHDRSPPPLTLCSATDLGALLGLPSRAPVDPLRCRRFLLAEEAREGLVRQRPHRSAFFGSDCREIGRAHV